MHEGLVINTNTAATLSIVNLAINNARLQQAITRLSSGIRLNSSSDDAGGLAVSMKMEATLKRNAAAQSNVGNAVSFLQTQDGALSTVTEVLERVSELKLLSTDVTKSANDIANYDTEFDELKSQLINLQGEKFNSVSLFSNTDSTTITVTTSADASQTIDVTKSNVYGGVSAILSATDLSDIASVTTTTTAIDNVTSLRAQNGAETNSLSFASTMLTTNRTTLQSTISRIKDTDIAEESTKLAKYSILVKSGIAMLIQANASPLTALKLLG